MKEDPVQAGYVCAPYMHSHDSVELKDEWFHSKNVESMYFVTATFSAESRPYFDSFANYYILAKFKDDSRVLDAMEKHAQDNPSFVFSMNEDFFERTSENSVNFVSIYYMDYVESDEDLGYIATIVGKREKIEKASMGNMRLVCRKKQKFTFPYAKNIIVLEVSSEKSHQSVNKYCENTRRNVSRKGITLTNLVGFSILERLK